MKNTVYMIDFEYKVNREKTMRARFLYSSYCKIKSVKSPKRRGAALLLVLIITSSVSQPSFLGMWNIWNDRQKTATPLQQEDRSSLTGIIGDNAELDTRPIDEVLSGIPQEEHPIEFIQPLEEEPIVITEIAPEVEGTPLDGKTDALLSNDDRVEIIRSKSTVDNELTSDGWKDIDNTLTSADNMIYNATENGTVQFTELNGEGGVQISDELRTIQIIPLDAQGVPAQNELEGRNGVVYEEAWRGVDLEYDYEGIEIKENIVLKNKEAVNEFLFKIGGVNLSQDADGKIFIVDTDIQLFEYTVEAWEMGPVDVELTTTLDKDTVTITLDREWLQGLDEVNFPVLIDPHYRIARKDVGGDYGRFKNFKSDGYSCTSATCWQHIGGLNQAGVGRRVWRTAFHIPYNHTAGKHISHVRVHLGMKFNSGWAGHTGCRKVNLRWMAGFGYNTGSGPTASGTICKSGWIDATNIFRYMRDTKKSYGGWIVAWGEENTSYSYKKLDPRLTLADFYVTNYNRQPGVPSVDIPRKNETITTTRPTLRLYGSTDADKDKLKYYFRVMSQKPSSCKTPVGIVANSGWVDQKDWKIPEGVLQDGESYWFCAHVFDGANTTTHSQAGGSYYNNTSPIPFRIELRSGQDATQSYDNYGPFQTNQATGSVFTSVSTHSIAALGGDIGLELNYDSPVGTKAGVRASYYNNKTHSGAPIATRIEDTPSFNYEKGSPIPGVVNIDNFSVKFEGNFLTPETGEYFFGGYADDSMKILVNGTQVYNKSCYSSSTKCYQTGVTLQKGQAASIEFRYSDATSRAYMRPFVKGPVREQIIPSEWLRTPLDAITETNGLLGRYYDP